MAIAFDAASSGNSSSANPSFTHTPSGTPAGVIVYIAGADASKMVTAVTYGGASMTEVTGSPNTITGVSEEGGAQAFFLGSSIATGAQTVAITGVSASRNYAAYTVTAASDTEVNAVDTSISEVTNSPSSTLALGGVTSFVAVAFFNGSNAIGGFAPASGWTSTRETDFGFTTGGQYRYDTVGSSDVTVTWTQNNTEEIAAIAVAVSEATGGGGLSIPVAMYHYNRMR